MLMRTYHSSSLPSNLPMLTGSLRKTKTLKKTMASKSFLMKSLAFLTSWNHQRKPFKESHITLYCLILNTTEISNIFAVMFQIEALWLLEMTKTREMIMSNLILFQLCWISLSYQNTFLRNSTSKVDSLRDSNKPWTNKKLVELSSEKSLELKA